MLLVLVLLLRYVLSIEFLICREIGRMNGKVLQKDSAGAKNIATFMEEVYLLSFAFGSSGI